MKDVQFLSFAVSAGRGLGHQIAVLDGDRSAEIICGSGKQPQSTLVT
jgi:hypothetical protein